MTARHIGTALALLSLGLGFWAPFEGLDAGIQRVLGLAVCAILLWTTEPIPIELTSLAILLILPASGLLSFADSFAPFAGKTVWLVFAGMGLSLAISETGLGDRLAQAAMRIMGRSRASLLVTLHLIGLGAAFLIPAGVVRVLLLIPFGQAVVERVGDRDDGRLHLTVQLSLLCSTYYGGSGILTGTVPNLVAAGQYEAVTSSTLFWSEWLVWMFPVIGCLRTLLCLGVIWVMFARHLAPRILADGPRASTGPKVSLDSSQRRVLLVLIAGVALWSTDVVHGVAPTYISLGLLCLLMAPGWGPLGVAVLRQINFPFLFYIAALFAVGTALQYSGFNVLFVERLATAVDLESYNLPLRHLLITLMVVPLDFLMDIAAVAGVMMPGMIEFGVANGMAPLATALSVAMATTLVFLPYQSAPFMVAISQARLSMGRLSLLIFVISLLSLMFICPLNILYWLALGLI